jgi:hypothetical protein
VGKDGTLLKVTEAPGMEGTTASYKRFMQKVRASAPPALRRSAGRKRAAAAD